MAVYFSSPLFSFFFFSGRGRHTIFDCDWSQTCALPISRGPRRLSLLLLRRRDADPVKHVSSLARCRTAGLASAEAPPRLARCRTAGLASAEAPPRLARCRTAGPPSGGAPPRLARSPTAWLRSAGAAPP